MNIEYRGSYHFMCSCSYIIPKPYLYYEVSLYYSVLVIPITITILDYVKNNFEHFLCCDCNVYYTINGEVFYNI